MFHSVSDPSDSHPTKPNKKEEEINFKYARDLFCNQKKHSPTKKKVIVVGKFN